MMQNILKISPELLVEAKKRFYKRRKKKVVIIPTPEYEPGTDFIDSVGNYMN